MSNDRLPLADSVAVNKQISEVILMLGNDAILVAYQINACYNTYARDGMCVVKSIKDSFKEAI